MNVPDRQRRRPSDTCSLSRPLVTLAAATGLLLLADPQRSTAEAPVGEIKIAFIGDQGMGANALAVLQLIRDENVDAVVHSGDFDYNDDPAAWDAMISEILGEDMPYFASVGNHDDSAFYGAGGYQEYLEARLNRIAIVWSGDLGVRSTLGYRGILMVMTAPDIFVSGDGDSVHAPFIRDVLAGSEAVWRISSFHKNMSAMQAGSKGDETGWGVYEESRRGGAIVATGHEHSYSRTHLLSEMQTQTCAHLDCAVPPDNTLVLAADDPQTPEDEGRSFAFVSGLGGRSVRDQNNDGPWFASIYTSDQGASPGALFAVFNYQGNHRLARFYMKDIAGNVPDEFMVSSSVGGAKPSLRIDDAGIEEGDSGTRLVRFAVTLEFANLDPVTVDYSTSDVTAEAGEDYEPRSGRLTFAPGETTQTIEVEVRGDEEIESDESFQVDLFDPGHARLADAQATGTILNDDVETFALTVNVSGSGSVEVDPAGRVYEVGTSVTLRALPAPGWEFGGWSEDLGGVANPETLTMDSDRRVAASFVELPPPNQAPSATIVAPPGPVTIHLGEPVTFAAAGSDPDGNLPLAYHWRFGTSGLPDSMQQSPGALVFATVGSFQVSLTVSDALGLADPTPATVQVTVEEPPPPNQAPESTIAMPVGSVTIELGEPVTFAGAGSDPDGNLPLAYHWSFADSGLADSTLQNPGALLFPAAGVFQVELTVSDALGLADPTPATVQVTVVEPPPNQAPESTIVAPAGPVAIQVGEAVTFAGAGSDPDGNLPLAYHWSFADSGIADSTSQAPGALVFLVAGTFDVELTVSDALGLEDPTPATLQVSVQESPPPGPSFADVSAEAGVDYLQQGVASGAVAPSDLRDLTGGAAAADFDRDGDVDLYVTRLDAPGILFRNRGDGTFEDATADAGLDRYPASNGAAWGDVDNDGDPDLYVTSFGPAETRFYLFVNAGDGTFTEEAGRRGCALEGPDAHFGFSVALGDYDLDGWLDLHTTEWRSDADNPLGARANARLLRNRGAAEPGFFDDVTDAAGVALEDSDALPPGISGTFALSSRFADLDDDGWPELLVVGGYGSSRLFWNNGDGTFQDGTRAARVGTDANGAGSAVGDLDGDGLPDWLVASVFDPADPLADGNRLYRNAGDRIFADHTDLMGVREAGWSVGAVFFDIDNDADLDLVVTNGISGGPPEATRVWRNDAGGGMHEVGRPMGIREERPGRGVLTFDYDTDGDLDLFIVNNAGRPELYRNDLGNQGDWLRVVAVGSRSNRDGIGAVVRVFDGPGPPQRREIDGGSHFLGQSEPVAHFGLGAGSDPVERVEVFWPASGQTNVFEDAPRNATLTAMEPMPNGSSGGGGGGGGGCGLLGIEPALPLAALTLRRRRRGR